MRFARHTHERYNLLTIDLYWKICELKNKNVSAENYYREKWSKRRNITCAPENSVEQKGDDVSYEAYKKWGT